MARRVLDPSPRVKRPLVISGRPAYKLAMNQQAPHRPPLIGITLDSEEPGGYSKFPWYALRQNYCSAVTQTGGLPFVSKTSEFGTILSCIEKHIEESRDRSAAGSTSGSSEVWDIG